MQSWVLKKLKLKLKDSITIIKRNLDIFDLPTDHGKMAHYLRPD